MLAECEYCGKAITEAEYQANDGYCTECRNDKDEMSDIKQNASREIHGDD